LKIHFVTCPFFPVSVSSSAKTIKGNQKHSLLNLRVPDVLCDVLCDVFPV